MLVRTAYLKETAAPGAVVDVGLATERSGLGEEHDHQQSAKHGAKPREHRDEPLTGLGEFAAADRVLDFAVAPERVHGAEGTDSCEADPDRGVGPGLAARERRDQLSRPDADGEGGQSCAPPREVGPLVREPGSPRGVAGLLEALAAVWP